MINLKFDILTIQIEGLKDNYLNDYSEQIALVSRGEHEDEEDGIVLRNSSREDLRTSMDEWQPWKLRENGHGRSTSKGGYGMVESEEA